MNISKRLKTISDFVIKGNIVADVGADHGLVEKYLIENEISPKVIAIENKIGPFDILKNALKNTGKVEILLSDGIKDINSEVKTVIVAGMGGINVVNILTNNPKKLINVDQIIIDAHRDQSLVRSEIIKLGYKIQKEEIVFEQNKFYNIISFIKGKSKYNKTQLEWGYNVDKLEIFDDYKKHHLNLLKKKVKALENSKNFNEKDVIKLKNKIERLNNYGNK